MDDQTGCLQPLAVTVRRASELTGLGQTTLWGYVRTGALIAVRPPGTRRTLVAYDSLKQLLKPLARREATPRRRRMKTVAAQMGSGA